ncbi:MAG: response regulator transcription factor [Crocinitomicaceae bacterium]|jgi:two-component system alkaline phosphatase synthesis response regulator PhoP|nr:response regulator transcription factor [Crocinitomicaceae bacterium]MDG1735080.1 response regulator transcription factor [Crocinitomicaceae bacterium]
MQKKSILIVDDDQDIRDLLSYNLQKSGYSVNEAINGFDCLEKIKTIKPNLILLDVMMPEMDGLEVCQQIKSDPKNHDILICFLTARGEDYSQIAALEAGGDDYVTKPIKPKVLISRINAILRRTVKDERAVKDGFYIDNDKYIVHKEGDEFILPKKEFELLSLLMSKPNHVFRRNEILDTVWGTEIVVGDRTIDVHIRKLRGKIGDTYISTIKGVGYKFNA